MKIECMTVQRIPNGTVAVADSDKEWAAKIQRGEGIRERECLPMRPLLAVKLLSQRHVRLPKEMSLMAVPASRRRPVVR